MQFILERAARQHQNLGGRTASVSVSQHSNNFGWAICWNLTAAICDQIKNFVIDGTKFKPMQWNPGQLSQKDNAKDCQAGWSPINGSCCRLNCFSSRLTKVALNCKTLVTKTKQALKEVNYGICTLHPKLPGWLGWVNISKFSNEIYSYQRVSHKLGGLRLFPPKWKRPSEIFICLGVQTLVFLLLKCIHGQHFLPGQSSLSNL